MGIRKEIRTIRDLPDELKTNEVSPGSKMVFQRLAANSNKQLIFVVRNHPFSAKVLKDYLSKRYVTIDLDEVMNGTNIISNNRNAYYFKATGSSGGHYNHDGHKALGDFLATKLQIFFCDSKIPSDAN